MSSRARFAADTSERTGVALGRIALATFAAPESLRALGGTVFAATHDSRAEQRLTPGASVHLAFGMLEKSNVSVIESMMLILAAQRAYLHSRGRYFVNSELAGKLANRRASLCLTQRSGDLFGGRARFSGHGNLRQVGPLCGLERVIPLVASIMGRPPSAQR